METTKIKTTSKSIDGGQKHEDPKDLTSKVILSWPAGRITIESAAMVTDSAIIIAAVDSQLKQHDASGLWRTTNGFTDVDENGFLLIPTVKTGGKKFYLEVIDGEPVLRVNWDYVPAERTGADDKTAAVLSKAKVLASALGTTVEFQILDMVCDRRTKEAALAAYKSEA